MAIPTLLSTLTNNLDNNTVPKKATFTETYTSIQTYIDTNVRLNFNQLIADLFASGYEYDNDGNANYVTPLEDLMSKKATDETISGAKTFTATTTFQSTVTSNSTFSSSGQHRCRVFIAANQSIATATASAITFTTEAFDAAGLFTPSASRITIPDGGDGAYRFGAQINFAANATGVRRLMLYKNGAEVARANTSSPDGTEETFLQIEYVDEAVATDYYEVYVYQTSGGNLDCNGNAGGTLTFFHAMKVW